MKTLKLLVGTLLLNGALIGSANAQDHIYNWSSPLGSNQNELGTAIASDVNGNVISAGYFRNTIDFDQGPGTTNLTAVTSADIFVQKHDLNGNLIWAKQIGGNADEVAESVAVDLLGNIIVTGYFSGTADFDPGAGVQSLTSAGSNDLFMVKLDMNGDFVWAHNLGSTGTDHGRAVVVDATGASYFTGFFNGTVDFDPGAGTANMTTNGLADFFILKLDAAGNYVWSKNIGGAGNDDGFGIALDAAGNIYTTGYITNTVDMDPNAGTQNLVGSGNDIFVSKLDPAGNYVWAQNFGSAANEAGADIIIDGAGDVIVTGSFTGVTDFDFGTGTTNLTATGGDDIFVAKYDQNGAFQWANSFGSSLDETGSALSVDASNNIYTAGFFRGTVDFDPGAATTNVTSNGGADGFILKLDNTGGFTWVKSFGGTANDHAIDIAYDVNNAVSINGYYTNTVDLDPGTGVVNSTAAGGSDILILNLKECFPDFTNDYVASCGAYNWIDGNTYTTSNYSATHTLQNQAGCDSIVTLKLTVYDITDEIVSPVTTDFCESGSSTISIASSQCDVKYYLRDDANDTIVDGPLMGNGGQLDFTTGTISQSMTYNIYAEVEEEAGVDFDKSQLERLEVSNPFYQYGSELTIEAWVYFDGSIDDVPRMGQSISGVDNMTSSNVWLWHDVNAASNDMVFYVNDNGVWRQISSTGFSDLSGWHHIATTADATGLSIYLDGVLNASNGAAVTTGIQNVANSILHFGGDPRFVNTISYHGTYGLSEARIWSISKSQSDIQNNMQECLNGNETDLVYYNKINNGSGSIATAVTGNDAVFSANMDPNTDWNAGKFDLSATCDLEMTQTTTVTVHQSTSATQTESVCDDYTWPINSTNYTATGMYTATIPNAAGCDSVITLDLTINTPTSSSFTAGACVTYTVPSGDESYTTSGIYMDTIPNMAGCDSVMTIDVTIGAATSSITETACYTYTVPSGDETYTTSGMYMDTIPSMAGCDSIISIDLTINTVNVSVTNTDPTLMSDATGATYQWLDCGNGNAVITGATNQTYTASANGSYAVEVTENGCVDTSACETIATVSVFESAGFDVKIYPNPSQGEVWIELPQFDAATVMNVYSLDGKMVYTDVINQSKQLIQLNELEGGLYTIELIQNEDKFISKIRLF